MADYGGAERRQFPRINSNFSLDVAPSKIRRGQSQNLSQNGLLFTHSAPVAVDSLLDVTLRVPGLTGSVTTKARVVRCDPTGVGEEHHVAVKFVNIDEETETAIKDLLQNY